MITTTAALWPTWDAGTKRALPSWRVDAYARATNVFRSNWAASPSSKSAMPKLRDGCERVCDSRPDDSYANDFLATVYFLEGNTEAALKYWNRVAKPHIEKMRIEPGLRVDPALLDRAIAFAPASTLLLPDFLTTQTRVEGLGIFPASGWHLEALDNGSFNMAFQAQERNGWGDGKWEALLSTFRGAFYQTAYPEYFNWGARQSTWLPSCEGTHRSAA